MVASKLVEFWSHRADGRHTGFPSVPQVGLYGIGEEGVSTLGSHPLYEVCYCLDKHLGSSGVGVECNMMRGFVLGTAALTAVVRSVAET